MKRSLAQRILAFHFLVLALPLYVATCLFFERFYHHAIDAAYARLQGVVQSRHIALEAPLSEVGLQDILFFLSDDPKQFVQQLAALPGQFMMLSLPTQVGDPYPVLGKSNTQVFMSGGEIEAILEQGHGSFVRYIGTQLMIGRGAVIAQHGRPEGVLLAIKPIEMTPQAEAWALLNRDGVVLTATDRALVGQTFEVLSLAVRTHLLESGALGEVKVAATPLQVKGREFIFQGKTFLIAHASFPAFSVAAYLPKQAFFMQAMWQFSWIYATYAAVLIVGIVLADLLSRWISRPLRELGRIMGLAHQGDLGARFVAQPLGFEFNALGDLFNHTLEMVMQHMKGAEEERIKKETYAKEVEVGREMQNSLVSVQLPTDPRIEVAARYVQAEDVGGDFYCIESMANHSLLMAVGDASGKGISSCLYALTARSLLRSYAKLHTDVGEILRLTNDAFLEQTEETGMFVAALVGIFDPTSGVLSYYSCGHTPGFVKRKDGTLVRLEHSGMALGLIESEVLRTDAILLHPGDIAIFFTKGLDLMCPIQELLQQRKWTTAQEVVDGLFTESQQTAEEVVLLAVKMV